MSKEMWFKEFERIYNETSDSAKAYKLACDKADAAYRERLADQADHARLRVKEGR